MSDAFSVSNGAAGAAGPVGAAGVPAGGSGAIVGARLRTLDPTRPAATAIAWRDGVITAVGDDATVRDSLSPGAELIDGAGLTITPGLVDGHLHPFLGTDASRGVDLQPARTLAEVDALLTQAATSLPDGAWLLGHSLSPDVFPPGSIRADLLASGRSERPLHLSFFAGHSDLANQAALRSAGIDGPRRFTSASEIVCDPDGRPTGELLELAAMNLVREAIPPLTREQRLGAYAATLARMNAVGLTGAHVMSGDRELLGVVAELEARGDLTMRLAMPLRNEPETDDEEIALRLPLANLGGRRWSVRIAKFFLDGVISAGTAWVLSGGPGGENQAPFWPDPARYSELVDRFTRAGFVCVSHAVGDGAVRAALDAYARAGRPARGFHRVEHIETLVDEDLRRFVDEGVAASMQPLHMESIAPNPDGAWRTKLTPDRVARGFRSRDLADSGALMVLGSDWNVAPFDPRIGMAWAQLRRAPGQPAHLPYLPEQTLDAATVLDGYTLGPAAVLGDAHLRGMLKPGMQADLTGWGADPLETSPDALLDVPMSLTVVDGMVMHRSASA